MKNISKSTLFSSFINLLVVIFLSCQLLAQTPDLLLRSIPEAEGVSSEQIICFLDAVSKSRHEFHSIMILCHGKVIAEGWWNPYQAGLKHTMYSTSKSFTATAVGFAVAEKRLTVNDKVISFFPGDLPDTVSQYLSELRIKDLLTMSVGQQPDPTGKVAGNEISWVKTFLKIPIIDQPGTKFLYNSAATYMLSAIIQKVTGEKVLDYLKPRLFDPLGINGIDWETDPLGINTGGWGLRLKTEDMAKFGQLFLQKGLWQGKQILPVSWIDEASTKKIDQDPNAPQTKKDSSDWLQGYCYQMWRSRNNSYRADGAFGQYILILPEKDAVIAITSESPDMQSELNLVWKYLLPGFKPGKLNSNPELNRKLKDKLDSLALPLAKSRNSENEIKISEQTFGFETNERNLEKASFEFKNGICHLSLKMDSITHQLNFGAGKWENGETTMFGPYLVSGAKHNRVGLSPFKIAGNYYWKDEKTLELILRYIESPHNQTIRCCFEDESVSIDFADIFEKPDNVSILKGKILK